MRCILNVYTSFPMLHKKHAVLDLEEFGNFPILPRHLAHVVKGMENCEYTVLATA